ncbi:hypothetical protein [Vibrio jasicida]|uniref:hypothetical protein n=1 Tax=Vibrio jasicida TaxID=766224 RepID=UPI0005EEAEB8|nr:hypothetical protein [Vibrio jasicida]
MSADLGVSSNGKYLKRLDQVDFDSTRLRPPVPELPYDTWVSVLDLTGSFLLDLVAVAASNGGACKVKLVVDGVELTERTIDTQSFVPIVGVTGESSGTNGRHLIIDGAKEYVSKSLSVLIFCPTGATYGMQVLARYSRVEVADL